MALKISLMGLLFIKIGLYMILFRSWVAWFSVQSARMLRMCIPTYETLKSLSLYHGVLSLVLGVLFVAGLVGPDESSMSASDINIGIFAGSITLCIAGTMTILIRHRLARIAVEEGDLILGRKLSQRQYKSIALVCGSVCVIVALLVLAGILPYEF
jgi:hypothetical protein